MFISSAKKKRNYYAGDSEIRLRAIEHCDFIVLRIIERQMLAIRLYVTALTSLFLFLVIANRGLGILEAVVITCAILYLILDTRTELQASRNELRLLQELEKRLSVLLR